MQKPTMRFFKQQLAEIARGPAQSAPECSVRLNRNENPWDWPDSLKQQALERAREAAWNRYPPYENRAFLEKLARHYGVQPGQLIVANGSNELIFSLFAATLEAGRKVVIPQPGYRMYRRLAEVFGADIATEGLNEELQYDRDALEAAAQDAQVVVIASPHNPSGCVIDPMDLEHLVQTTSALWVVDEAYFEFHGESAMELAATCGNLVVLRTFSKAYGAAGLRFGAMICHPEARQLFEAASLPYSVNHFTMAAIEVAMEHAVTLRARVEELRRERERVARLLRQRRGVKVYPSRANFLLFETDREPRALWQAMVRRGVLVRDVSKGPRLSRALRVTIGLPEENDAFLNALDYAITAIAPTS